ENLVQFRRIGLSIPVADRREEVFPVRVDVHRPVFTDIGHDDVGKYAVSLREAVREQVRDHGFSRAALAAEASDHFHWVSPLDTMTRPSAPLIGITCVPST